jgi:hypothetical protein
VVFNTGPSLFAMTFRTYGLHHPENVHFEKILNLLEEYSS